MHEASFGAIRKLAFFVHFFTAKRPGARGEFTPEMSANFFCVLCESGKARCKKWNRITGKTCRKVKMKRFSSLQNAQFYCFLIQKFGSLHNMPLAIIGRDYYNYTNKCALKLIKRRDEITNESTQSAPQTSAQSIADRCHGFDHDSGSFCSRHDDELRLCHRAIFACPQDDQHGRRMGDIGQRTDDHTVRHRCRHIGGGCYGRT